jgi:hypothetical protein
VTTDLIRWTDASDGGFFGFAGNYAPAAFKVIPPAAGEEFWTLHNYICPLGVSGFGETEADAKQQAETWLREFVSSLGALFAADLREHLTEQAAIEQELGDDYSDSASPLAESQSHLHWGRAEALRDVLKYLDQEAEVGQ